MHCFTGTQDELDAYLELGFFIGLTGFFAAVFFIGFFCTLIAFLAAGFFVLVGFLEFLVAIISKSRIYQKKMKVSS